MVLLIKTRLYNLIISKLRINACLVFFNRHLRLISSYYYIYIIYIHESALVKSINLLELHAIEIDFFNDLVQQLQVWQFIFFW